MIKPSKIIIPALNPNKIDFDCFRRIKPNPYIATQQAKNKMLEKIANAILIIDKSIAPNITDENFELGNNSRFTNKTAIKAIHHNTMPMISIFCDGHCNATLINLAIPQINTIKAKCTINCANI